MKTRIVLAGLAAALACGGALAQSYPSKPLRIIVSVAPGGVIDALSRALAVPLRDSTGQPVIVENRPGASTIIGMNQCAKSPADGYTICITNPDSLSYGPHLFSNLPYDPNTDFAPIINLGWTNNILVAHIAAPFNSYKELIAYAKAKPGALNWATWGTATLPDLYLRWTRHTTGVDIVGIPFNGAAEGNPSVYSGQSQITYMGVGTALPQIKAGKIKALVGIGTQRLKYMPDLPTLAEEGTDPGLRSFFGAYAPGKTPRPVVERLNQELHKAIQTPKVLDLMRGFTVEPIPNTPDEFAEFSRADRENAGKVFRLMGITPQKSPM